MGGTLASTGSRYGNSAQGEAPRKRTLAFIIVSGTCHLVFSDGTEAYLSTKVGVPYLQAKARDYYDSLGGGINPDIVEHDAALRQSQALTNQVLRSVILT
jgi:hypothetical protein